MKKKIYQVCRETEISAIFTGGGGVILYRSLRRGYNKSI